MTCDKKQRYGIKRGSGRPTIPVSSDHRNGDWLATDIYEGEQYQDIDTGAVYTRNAQKIIDVEKSRSIVNSVVNITESSVADAFVNFTTDTIAAPQTINGDEIKITAVFRNEVQPATDGYGLYFFFDNAEYVHPASPSPTYGNSFFQLPFDRDLIWCEIVVHRIDDSNAYIICKQVVSDNSTLSNPTVYGEEAYANISLDWSVFTGIKVQTFITGGGEITLEYLKVNKISE